MEKRLKVAEKTHVWRVDSKMERRLKKKLLKVEDRRLERVERGSRFKRRLKDRRVAQGWREDSRMERRLKEKIRSKQ